MGEEAEAGPGEGPSTPQEPLNHDLTGKVRRRRLAALARRAASICTRGGGSRLPASCFGPGSAAPGRLAGAARAAAGRAGRGAALLPGSLRHALSQVALFLDRHLVFPLLEFLQTQEVYPAAEILQAKIELLQETNMVDFALDIHASLHGPDAPAAGAAGAPSLGCSWWR